MSKANNDVGPQTRKKKKSIGSKVVPALGIASFVAASQAATQFFAWKFEYQAVLGAHINHVYAPWAIYDWWNKWYGVYPEALTAAGSVGTLVAAGGLIGTALAKIVAANSSKGNEYLHGSARWADREDIEQASLLGNEGRDGGVYVGAWRDKYGKLQYLRHNGPEHVLCYAPTRSGKGVGLVLPTLLSWPHSAVITDLKGELWAMTAGWRKKHAGNKVIRFEPASANGCAEWNALDEIRIGTEAEVGDVQNLATLVVDPDGKGLKDHWQKTAQALLVGVILHALYKAKDEGTIASLPSVDGMLADPNRDVSELWMEMTQYGHVNGENHPVIGRAGRDMMDRPEEEAGSVLSSAKSYLSLYRDPVVARNVSKSTWRIKDLMNHDDPVSLYIVTQPVDKERLKPLVRVLVNMIVRLLADKMEFERIKAKMPLWRRILDRIGFKQQADTYVRSKKSYKHRLLMQLDEFPSMGKLSIIQESLAFLAGYGVKFYLICQDINQLKSQEEGYGADESISSNCHVQNAYPPNRIETAQHLSKLTGVTTVLQEQVTTSGKRAGIFMGQVSKTIQAVQRPLLTDDECMRMPGPKKDAEGQIKEPGDMVVYVAGFPAIYGEQPLYFQDPIFTARAAVEEPKDTDRLRLQNELSERELVAI
ncbi:type IV secretory system conjugative DNA transfer family protein [Pseudomonas syringae]|uniref:type IV secretory system conjugative DNA transfer family protein n=1 Tax=Pseudomonas syringae TaxID=317 RepID=UPI0002099176|nr:type IV secretory system conjugative DNA transfer family protein [Pseudomonas syringae]MDP5168559.1 type IV secretory system conjugative DNA transfer family protein [Pseudomonas syringae pv. aptata str. DSM 50252]